MSNPSQTQLSAKVKKSLEDELEELKQDEIVLKEELKTVTTRIKSNVDKQLKLGDDLNAKDQKTYDKLKEDIARDQPVAAQITADLNGVRGPYFVPFLFYHFLTEGITSCFFIPY